MGDRSGGWLIWRVGEGEGVVGVGKRGEGGGRDRERGSSEGNEERAGKGWGVAGGIGFEVAVEKGRGGGFKLFE